MAQTWNIQHKITCPRLENPGTLITGRALSSSTTWQSCQQPHSSSPPPHSPSSPLLLWWMSRVGQLLWAYAGITIITTLEPIVNPVCGLPCNCWHVSSGHVQSSLGGWNYNVHDNVHNFPVFLTGKLPVQDILEISHFYHTRRKKCAVSARFSIVFINSLFYLFVFLQLLVVAYPASHSGCKLLCPTGPRIDAAYLSFNQSSLDSFSL